MFPHEVTVIEVTQVADEYMGQTNSYAVIATNVKGRLYVSTDAAGGVQISPPGAFERYTHEFLTLTYIEPGNMIDDENNNRYWVRKTERKSTKKKHHHYKCFLERTDENVTA